MENAQTEELNEKADWLKTTERPSDYFTFPEGETELVVVGEKIGLGKGFVGNELKDGVKKLYLTVEVKGQPGQKIWSMTWQDSYGIRSLFGQLKKVVLSRANQSLVGAHLRIAASGKTGDKKRTYIVTALN